MEMIIQFLVYAIVTWRLTHLLSAEDGPFDIIFKFRSFLGSSFWGKLMDCFYCLSIWIGLALAFSLNKDLTETLVMGAYYSGVAILLEKLTNKQFN
jgi:hypothetical protein